MEQAENIIKIRCKHSYDNSGTHYGANPARLISTTIPYYVKPNFIDIHDTYTKRSMEEVRAEVHDKEFDIYYQRLICSAGDYHKEQKEQKAIAIIEIDQFNFTQYQLERFKVLVGERFKPEKNQVKFSCNIFPSYEANFQKVNEQICEVLMEAKRAP